MSIHESADLALLASVAKRRMILDASPESLYAWIEARAELDRVKRCFVNPGPVFIDRIPARRRIDV